MNLNKLSKTNFIHNSVTCIEISCVQPRSVMKVIQLSPSQAQGRTITASHLPPSCQVDPVRLTNFSPHQSFIPGTQPWY